MLTKKILNPSAIDFAVVYVISFTLKLETEEVSLVGKT